MAAKQQQIKGARAIDRFGAELSDGALVVQLNEAGDDRRLEAAERRMAATFRGFVDEGSKEPQHPS